jgi:hypothetical protein
MFCGIFLNEQFIKFCFKLGKTASEKHDTWQTTFVEAAL